MGALRRMWRQYKHRPTMIVLTFGPQFQDRIFLISSIFNVLDPLDAPKTAHGMNVCMSVYRVK